MRTDIFNIFIISVGPTLISTSFAYLRFIKGGAEFKHLFEFHVSMIFMTTVSFLTWPMDPGFVALSLLSWLWPLRTMLVICEDLTGKSLFQRDHYVALSIGGLFSTFLYFFKNELLIFTAPFAVSVGLVGASFLLQALRKNTKCNFNPLRYLFYFLTCVFITSRATFPMWIQTRDGIEFGLVFECFLLVLFNVSLLPLYLEAFNISTLEKAINVRNQQLFSRSSFSEFKILSAGVTHEINNALTIINAKTE